MAELFDRAHFDAMTASDATLQCEVAALFVGQVEKWRAALSVKTAPGECRDCAHTLKGSARGLGLWRLAEACATAETAVGGPDGEAALGALHHELDVALEALAGFAQSSLPQGVVY